MLAVAGSKNYVVKHYDVQTAYLNADLSHDVFMKQPKGYQINEDETLVYKLKKNLYGLKQGASEWNKKLDEVLHAKGYIKSENDPCLYKKLQDGEWLYISIYVDDLIAASSSNALIGQFQEDLNECFVLKDLGDLHYYLGLQFERDQNGTFFVHQKTYIEKKLKEFRLQDSRPSYIPVDPGYQKRQDISEQFDNEDVYRKAIGSLQYLANNSRPDIAVGVSILARRVSNPSQTDWTEVKRIFRYLNHTKDKKLRLGGVYDHEERQLIGYADADWGGDSEDRKSNTGYVFKFKGAPIMWSSHKQSMVTLSSTEAEYIALSEAAQEAVWIQRLLNELIKTLAVYQYLRRKPKLY